jgi:hypothetical protein
MHEETGLDCEISHDLTIDIKRHISLVISQENEYRHIPSGDERSRTFFSGFSVRRIDQLCYIPAKLESGMRIELTNPVLQTGTHPLSLPDKIPKTKTA